MIIKHLYHNDTHVANAFLHKRNATVDIRYDTDKIHYANVTLDFDELEEYCDRMDLSTGENEQTKLF